MKEDAIYFQTTRRVLLKNVRRRLLQFCLRVWRKVFSFVAIAENTDFWASHQEMNTNGEVDTHQRRIGTTVGTQVKRNFMRLFLLTLIIVKLWQKLLWLRILEANLFYYVMLIKLTSFEWNWVKPPIGLLCWIQMIFINNSRVSSLILITFWTLPNKNFDES